MKKISTTALGKKLKISSKEIFEILESNGYIEYFEKGFFNKEIYKKLTIKGEKSGGETVESSKYGTYIIWPEDFIPVGYNNNLQNSITVSKIGEQFGLTAKKVNQIISELGWTEKNLKGWKLTNFGKSLGGTEHVVNQTGATYTKWPEDITSNKSLIESIGGKDNIEDFNSINNNSTKIVDDFRQKFPAQYRTKDGHNVRSRGELLIDNSLYEYGLAHAYERKLPIEEDLYSDFYIPPQNGGQGVYIEYWGVENQDKYENRKEIKKDIYKKYHLNLIELDNHHVENLDDYLPRFLLKYGINVD